jgi:hypothetical protein
MGHAPAQRVVAAFLIYILTFASLWAATQPGSGYERWNFPFEIPTSASLWAATESDFEIPNGTRAGDSRVSAVCEPLPYRYGWVGDLVVHRFPNFPCSIDRLFGEWKDWLVGLLAGLIAGLIIVFLLHKKVPKIGISKSIAITTNTSGSGEHPAIKVINKRRAGRFVNHSAIDIRAELHVVSRDEGGHQVVNRIELVRHDPLIIPGREPRRNREPGISEYIFQIKLINGRPDLEEKLKSAVGIRFRLYARDSFSNYGRVFTQYYYNPDSQTGQLKQPSGWGRKDERPYGPIARGYWPIGSLDFKPYKSRSAGPQSGQAEPDTRSIPSGKQLLWAFAAMTLFAWLAPGSLAIRRPRAGPSEPPRAANLVAHAAQEYQREIT